MVDFKKNMHPLKKEMHMRSVLQPKPHTQANIITKTEV